ncbi:hypothetical protein NPIL_54771 [Nephila pilipes]|uniref:Uncharacterized protein n=1 Tax=Nephila pilipes TaxID=299642 RepID=A0A8X6TT83_NEPPI|nr:hypothetical protein NPIL_54771 [Nephila pilipes]
MAKRKETRIRKFKTKLRDKPECFSCKNYDQFVKYCPFSCTLCGKSEHCKKQYTGHKNPRMITISVRDQDSSTSNTYKKLAIINCHRVTALLDTESSSCLLKESVARNLGLNILSCEKYLYSFGNQLNQVTQSLGVITIDI